ncbi:MAG: proline--tRNA ligase, partial [Nanoarchaeota archaeon]|nr:proline--tRNA ligase [Nanoarchaeota archaeon]
MSKQKDNKGLTVKKSENFSEWYNQVVQKAELADYSDVKGFMVIRPNAYSIWEIITEYFNKRIKALGVRNAYFPLLIPESFFKKEAEHAKGFQPEVAWVSNREDERLAIRPTSETIMYDSYSKWIRSWRDLPLRINQWCNVVRWETKATRLFLRTREFLWQEGHCVYETEKECEEETKIYLKEYEKLCRDILAMPVLAGKKTEKEKFSGAKYTLSIEGIMPDGKALQMGTSHNLGQGFAKSFGISFLDKNEKRNTPWQNSWGVSTRLIGALTMVHGD